MEELTNKATDLATELATPAMVVMNSLVYLQESVKAMESGLEMHQLVKVSLPPGFNYVMTSNYVLILLSKLQGGASLYLIHLMEELISAATGLELQHFILVIVAMSLSVSPQEPARTMGSGLEMHQLVKVRRYNTIMIILCDYKF